MRIDPKNITDFNRTDDELEMFAIFAVLVAGKNAMTIAPRLEKFFTFNLKRLSPLDFIWSIGNTLPDALKRHGFGCYNQKAATLIDLAGRVLLGGIDLRTCTPEQLQQVKGIGHKTSRFFILHSRANARYAALDTHILKGLAAKYPEFDVPKVTPSNPKVYQLWENRFLAWAEFWGKNPAELDLEWWRTYSGNTV